MAKTSKSDREINKFELMAEDWWSPTGKFKPLHDLTPVRLKYIVNLAKKHFAIDSLKNITALDVGCGGGLITEALAGLELNITGIDASEVNITIAKAHAKKMELEIDYQQMLAENLLNDHVNVIPDEGLAFDRGSDKLLRFPDKLCLPGMTKEGYELILALEIVEHVEDLEFFIKTCCKLLAPGGLIIFSTLNKTIKSYLQAIIAAEYILKWVPKGTHDWKKFVKPSEINKYASQEGLELVDLQGLSYSLLSNTWSLSSDIGNNYFIAFSKIKNP